MLGLIKDGKFLYLVNPGGSFKLPNGNTVSPAYAGWEHEDGYTLIPIEDAPVIPAGKRIKDAVVELVNDVAKKQYTYEDIPPDPIPDRVSSRQFKLQLELQGLTAAVEGWVRAQPKLVQIAYDNSGTFDRTDRMLQSGFKALGFKPAQLDAFYAEASKL